MTFKYIQCRIIIALQHAYYEIFNQLHSIEWKDSY